MNISINHIASIINARSINIDPNHSIRYICIHTNDIIYPEASLFAALPGKLSHGHHYIQKAYEIGVRTFIVSDKKVSNKYIDACFLLVDNVLTALQRIAAYHRRQYNIHIIGITGSNGKTIIKEWLYQMLYDQYNIVKSPKSYNSQIGVPLSLFQINKTHNLGIIESGISTTGEMIHHSTMISPEIGIFSNIGDAHDNGFVSRQEKIREKSKLFKNSEVIICCSDHYDIFKHLQNIYPEKNIIVWSSQNNNSRIYLAETNSDDKKLKIIIGGQEYNWEFEFTDRSSIENIMHCITLMTHLGLSMEAIETKIKKVSGLEMRLEMKAGNFGSTIINDAYSADVSALQVALDFMNQQTKNPADKILILSKLEQSGMSEQHVLDHVSRLTSKFKIGNIHYISNTEIDLPSHFIKHKSKQELLDNLVSIDISGKTVLVKGPREARLEDIVNKLSVKTHSTKLTLNLDALAHNIRIYKSLLKPKTKIIAVVKASAYGSGSIEVTRVLAQHGINYLAVAFIDEGIKLRKKGVTLPIIVFNSDIHSLRDIVTYDLQLEAYGLEQLQSIVSFANQIKKHIKIHLKLDTGMHRLGFTIDQLDRVYNILDQTSFITIESIFSHLTSSEDEEDDHYSQRQFELFEQMYENVVERIQYSPLKHILNSSGITRFTEKQYDMVRLGLGLYGIDSGNKIGEKLQKVHALYSALIQIKKLSKGSSIGYNRRTTLEKNSKVGVVNIGYADGLLRTLGNGKYTVLINGTKCPILGTVSMDLIIVDLSNVSQPKVGDQVTIFDENHTLENLAIAADTIPYEILSRISDRVERIYIRS